MSEQEEKQRSNILIASIISLFFVALELIGGCIIGSASVASEALHDFGDAVTLFIAYIIERIARRHPNKRYTYGYQRFLPLGSLITATVIIIGGVAVIISALSGNDEISELESSGMILFAAIGLCINVIGFLLTRNGKEVNERMISLHLLKDVLNRILLIFGGLLIKITGWSFIDSIISIAIFIFILFEVSKDLRETFDILLNKTPADIDIDVIKTDLLKRFDIAEIHHVHIWSMDGVNHCMTAHIVLKHSKSIAEVAEIKEQIKNHLESKNIKHITLETEYLPPAAHSDTPTKNNREGEKR